MPLDKKNEKLALTIGFVLILLVGLITFLRPSLKSEETKNIAIDSNSKTADYPRISAKELLQKIDKKENAVFIDIRSNDAFQQEHITGSLNIPLAELKESEIDSSPTDLIVIVSDPAATEEAIQAVQILKEKNFENAMVLSGGINSWKQNQGGAVSWGDPTSFINQSKVTFISPEDAKKFLDEKRPIYILDVRPQNSFSPHLPATVNIPFESLEKRKDELPRGKEIIVYGDTELSSFQAGVRLFDLNIFSARVLRGGFTGWQEKRFPTEK
ncbi:MAG: rhodanese-like domain-containing protein [Candidatus Moranbacteria bacterium]|nr:rhodanese-like domain-containing protein [Candidatus Moranbacteria bacterium]